MAKGKFNFIAPVKPANLEAAKPASHVVGAVPSPAKIEAENNYLKTRLIPRDKIKSNPKNKYDMTDIESLAESILHYGLMQPLVVVYLMQEDIYMLETGHRRTAALNRLIDTYADWPDQNDPEYLLYKKYVKAFEKGYPCIISAKIEDGVDYIVPDDDLENTDPDVIRSEIRLHLTNCEVRDIDRARTIARLTQLYDALNSGKKKSEKININKQIASDMQITERQVINYKNVSRLIPELQEAFETKKITVKESSRIAQLNEDEQLTIVNLLNSENGDKAKINELLNEKTALNNALKKLQKDLQEKEAQLMALHNKKEELKNVPDTSSSPVLPAPDLVKKEEIERRDTEIDKLRQKIKALEHQKISIPVPTPATDEAAENLKIAVTLKSTLTDAARKMQELLEIINDFKQCQNPVFMTADELNKELDHLELILNAARL